MYKVKIEVPFKDLNKDQKEFAIEQARHLLIEAGYFGKYYHKQDILNRWEDYFQDENLEELTDKEIENIISECLSCESDLNLETIDCVINNQIENRPIFLITEKSKIDGSTKYHISKGKDKRSVLKAFNVTHLKNIRNMNINITEVSKKDLNQELFKF